MNFSNNILELALSYCDLGWSVIPLRPKSKEPLQAWKKSQKHRLDKDHIEKCWKDNPEANIGIVLGEISNLIAVDIDNPELFEMANIKLPVNPSTPNQKTSRGKHYFFKYQNGIKTYKANWGEIRSDGAYVVVAPSIHPGGSKYEWEISPFLGAVLPFPKELVAIIKDPFQAKGTLGVMNDAIIKQGARNSTLTSLAGSLRRIGFPENAIVDLISAINSKYCDLPLVDGEVRNIAISVGKYEPHNIDKLEHTLNKPKINKKVQFEVARLSEVQATKVDFLWKPYIPLGKLTIIEGDPGVGKSWLTQKIAANVSQGFGLPNMDHFQPGNVLLSSGEDGIADTIKPRLESLGANCENILAIKNYYGLDEKGLHSLESTIKQFQPKLVIIDPLSAYSGGKDLNKANEVRAITSPLATLAEEHNCAMIVVRHLVKGQRDKALYRGAGSIDIIAAGRSALIVDFDPTNPEKRVIVHNKSSLAAPGECIGFKIEDGIFQWTETDLSNEEYFNNGNQGGAREIAKNWLKRYLSKGPQKANDVQSAAKEKKISKSTLNRAKDELDIESHNNAAENCWYWALKAQSRS